MSYSIFREIILHRKPRFALIASFPFIGRREGLKEARASYLRDRMGLGQSSVTANENAPPAPHQRRPDFEAVSAFLDALEEASAKKPVHRASLTTSSSSDESIILDCSVSPQVESLISTGILRLGLEILLKLRRSEVLGQSNLIFSPYAIASTMAALLSDPSANTTTAKQ
ncbi:hypothetical protein MTO96_044506, partial [Rhipicephalus appendiculatus]